MMETVTICKRCGRTIAKRIQLLQIQPEASNWVIDGYCSSICYKKDKSDPAKAENIEKSISVQRLKIRKATEEPWPCPDCSTITHEDICPECGYNISNEKLRDKSKLYLFKGLLFGFIGFVWGAILGMFSSDVNEKAESMGKNLGILGVIIWITPIIMMIAMPIFVTRGLLVYFKFKSERGKPN